MTFVIMKFCKNCEVKIFFWSSLCSGWSRVEYNNTIRMMNVSQCSISLTNPYIRSGHLSNGILIIFYCNLLQNYRPSYTTSTKPSLLSYLSNYYIWKQSEACQRQNSETNTILYQNLTAQNRNKKTHYHTTSTF